MKKVESHVPVLDAIRGLAIALVLLTHIGGFMPEPTNIAWKMFNYIAVSSWVGVDLFFVLSGFLITGILYDTKEATNYFRAFYARRVLRIFPLYYGFLFLLFALTWALHIEWHGRQWLYLLYLQNAHVARHVYSTPFSSYVNIDHLWSLAVEEQFYCIWPALVFAIRDRVQLLKIAALLIIGSNLIRLVMLSSHDSFWMIYVFTPARADSLMIGSALALAFRSGADVQKWLKRLAVFLLPASLLALIALGVPTQGLRFASSGVVSVGFTILALAGAALITLSLTDARFEKAINRPALRWLGKYSYGIYVLHLPIMQLLLRLDMVSRLERFLPYSSWKLFIVTSTAACAVGAAFVVFTIYEARFLRLKRFFPYEWAEAGPKIAPLARAAYPASPLSTGS